MSQNHPASRQLPLPFPPATPADTLPRFFAAPSNQAALTWLETPHSWPDRRLLLWGERGVGKTHLLRGWAADAGAPYLGGAALRWPMPEVAMPDEGATSLAVDDADMAPEEPLLHLLNAAAAACRPVLLAARSPPARWPTRLADLASRLRALTCARIGPAEDDLLRAILLRLCAERPLAAPEPVQAFLLAHLPRNAAALQEAVARLDRAALANGGKVTRTLAAVIVDELHAMWHAETA